MDLYGANVAICSVAFVTSQWANAMVTNQLPTGYPNEKILFTRDDLNSRLSKCMPFLVAKTMVNTRSWGISLCLWLFRNSHAIQHDF